MFGNLSYTWSLMRSSWGVLKRDKQLLLFPLLSGICCLLVLASFAVPIFVTDSWHPPDKAGGAARQVLYYGTLFLYYFANYLVITFFNSAIIACAIERMRGGTPNLSYGFREAMSRLPLIIGWSLLAATIGLLLRAIEERSEWVGRLVAGLFGLAWGVTSFLVVPVLVVERKGPFAALKGSAALLGKTWGQQIKGNFGFGAIIVLLAIPGLLLAALGVYLGTTMPTLLPAAGCVLLAIVYLIGLALVQSALQSIFQAAVYLYASGGEIAPALDGPRGFPVQLLRQAMVAK